MMAQLEKCLLSKSLDTKNLCKSWAQHESITISTTQGWMGMVAHGT